jgi:hypothetical protein
VAIRMGIGVRDAAVRQMLGSCGGGQRHQPAAVPRAGRMQCMTALGKPPTILPVICGFPLR